MEGISYECLRVEAPPPDALGDGHEQVDEQANTGDAYAGIMPIPAGEVDVLAGRVVVVVADAVGVRVARVVSGAVDCGSHLCGVSQRLE